LDRCSDTNQFSRSLSVGLLCGFTSPDYCPVRDHYFLRQLVNRIWRFKQGLDDSIKKCINYHAIQNVNLFIQTGKRRVLVGSLTKDEMATSQRKADFKKSYRYTSCQGAIRNSEFLYPNLISKYQTDWVETPSKVPEGGWFLLNDPKSFSSPFINRDNGQTLTGLIASPSMPERSNNDSSRFPNPAAPSTENWKAQVYIGDNYRQYSKLYEGFLATAVGYHLIIQTCTHIPIDWQRRQARPS
jgi:hypothetical protein